MNIFTNAILVTVSVSFLLILNHIADSIRGYVNSYREKNGHADMKGLYK